MFDTAYFLFAGHMFPYQIFANRKKILIKTNKIKFQKCYEKITLNKPLHNNGFRN